MSKQSLRTGYSTNSGIGITQENPPSFLSQSNDPTLSDFANHRIGDLWRNSETLNVFILVSKTAYSGTWIKFGTSIIGTSFFVTDSGTAEQSDGDVNVLGASAVLDTSASGNTVVVNITNGANGQFIIGGGAEPIWGDITSPLGSVTITPGANSLNLEAIGISSILKIAGDVSFAVPTTGTINVVGGININTSALADSLWVNLEDNISIANSLTISALSSGVVQTDNAGLISSSKGLDGQVLISADAGVPVWANITSISGTAPISNGSNSIKIESSPASSLNAYSFLAVQYTTSSYYGNSPRNLGSLGNGMTRVFYEPGTLALALGPAVNPANPLLRYAMQFTAPRDGKYFFYAQVHMEKTYAAIQAEFAIVLLQFVINNYAKDSYGATTNDRRLIFEVGAFDNYNTSIGLNRTAYIDLDAGDTCSVTYAVQYYGNLEYYGGTITDTKTYFCGHYVG